MATGKTYWWIKLKKDFLTGNAIDFLMGEKDGANVLVSHDGSQVFYDKKSSNRN